MKTYVNESGHIIYLMREGETALGQMSSVEEAKDISSLINASEGMTNDEAVRYLTHGAEMVAEMKSLCSMCDTINGWRAKGSASRCELCTTSQLLALMEGK